MRILPKISIALFSLLLGCSEANGQQNQDTIVVWYESLLQENSHVSKDVQLKKITAKLNDAAKVKNGEEQALALKERGLFHLVYSKDYDLAMDHFIQCLRIEDSLGLSIQRVFTYLAMAKVFDEVGNYNKGEELLEQALTFNKELDDTNIQVLIFNELGQVSASLGKMDSARNFYQQVLELKDVVENPASEAKARFNIAHLYGKEGNYKRALENHKEALTIWRSLRDKANEAQSLNDIGELYMLMRNDSKALANHTVALEIRKSLKDDRGIAESCNNIGILYYDQKKWDMAIVNFQTGLQSALKSQALEEQQRSYDYLSLAYKEAGMLEDALQSREQYAVVSDFIQNQRYEQRLLESQNRYVIDTKQSQIEDLEQDRTQRERQLQTQKNLRNFLVGMIVLGGIIVLLIFYLYKTKQSANRDLQEINNRVKQQNIQLAELNATKDKFFSIIGHDLKGPLNSLTSFSRLLINHTDSLSKEEIQMLAGDFDKSLKNLFALLENLLEWSRSQTGNIVFTREVFDINLLLKENEDLLRIQAANKSISLSHLHDSEIMVHAHKNSIRTVVRNLISNAIKFTPERGTITINSKPNHNMVIVSIADTGVGMSTAIVEKLFRIDAKHSTKGTADEKGTGLGLILCKEFVEKNGGTLLVESQEYKGSIFSFTVPLSNS